MKHMLLPLFTWADHTWVAGAIRDSTWAFALLEVFHLFGITLLLGTLVVVNLRLFGWGLASHSLADVASDALPFTQWAMIATIISGSLLFASEAMKCYGSIPFFIKMGLLATALLFTFTFHRRLTKASQSSTASKFAAGFSIFLWFGVGLAGRAIAFF
jgi:branched-subunit amino acid transport protein